MPSPVGHLLGGVIVALGAWRPVQGAWSFGPGKAGLIVLLAAVAPDVDFLWGRHNRETHSLAAAILAGLVVFAWKRHARLAVAVILAWASHVLFDWLGSDATPPLGVMALWPLSSEFYFAHAYVFEAISRRYWLDNFVSHNLGAVAREVLILGPIVGVAWALTRRRRRRAIGPDATT